MIRAPTAADNAITIRQAAVSNVCAPGVEASPTTGVSAGLSRSAHSAPMTVEDAASHATQARLLTQTVALLPVGCQDDPQAVAKTELRGTRARRDTDRGEY